MKETWVELPTRSAQLRAAGAIQAGERVMVKVREISVAQFAEHLPDMVPDLATECYAAAPGAARQQTVVDWERWLTALLAQVVVEPPLTTAQVIQLGADRDYVGNAIMKSWGVYLEDSPARVLYNKTFRLMLRRMARYSKRLPSELLTLSVSEFWFNWLVLFGPETADQEAGDQMLESARG